MGLVTVQHFIFLQVPPAIFLGLWASSEYNLNARTVRTLSAVSVLLILIDRLCMMQFTQWYKFWDVAHVLSLASIKIS